MPRKNHFKRPPRIDPIGRLVTRFGQIGTAKMLGISQPSVCAHVNLQLSVKFRARDLAAKMCAYYL